MSASLVGSEMCIRDSPTTPCRAIVGWGVVHTEATEDDILPAFSDFFLDCQQDTNHTAWSRVFGPYPSSTRAEAFGLLASAFIRRPSFVILDNLAVVR
eukprot:12262163-Alexandrium_andersonii.AAC.1